MKKLLLLLFSLFFLSSPSVFADDISDFSIEGISIGDSLLDYMTEDEILEEIEKTKHLYQYLREPNKYAHVYLWKDFPTYDSVSVLIKNNSASKTVSIFFLIPATSAFMAWLFLNESLTNLDLVGFLITTIGVYIATRD